MKEEMMDVNDLNSINEILNSENFSFDSQEKLFNKTKEILRGSNVSPEEYTMYLDLFSPNINKLSIPLRYHFGLIAVKANAFIFSLNIAQSMVPIRQLYFAFSINHSVLISSNDSEIQRQALEALQQIAKIGHIPTKVFMVDWNMRRFGIFSWPVKGVHRLICSLKLAVIVLKAEDDPRADVGVKYRL